MNRDAIKLIALIVYISMAYYLGAKISQQFRDPPYDEIVFAIYFVLVPLSSIITVLAAKMHRKSYRLYHVTRAMLIVFSVKLALIVTMYALVFDWDLVF